jgi:hypothetical protein
LFHAHGPKTSPSRLFLDCLQNPIPQKSFGKVEIAFESVEEASKLFSVYGKTASRQKALKPKSNIVTQKMKFRGLLGLALEGLQQLWEGI